MQRELVDAILNYPGHIIATMRSKTEWQTGVKKPTRVGLAPEQGKGIEYEFDILFEINTGHLANIIKDRTGKFQDKIIDRPDKKFGREIAEWLSDGAPVVVSIEEQVSKLKVEFGRIMMTKDDEGRFLFNEEERAHAKGLLVELVADTPVVRKEKLDMMLADAKETLMDRADAILNYPGHINQELNGKTEMQGAEVPQNGTSPVAAHKTVPAQNDTAAPKWTQPEQSSAQIPGMYEIPEEPGDRYSYEYPDDVEAAPPPPPRARKPVPKLGEIPGVHRGVAPAAVPPKAEVTGEELDIF
jgi:hypothetical protein